MGYLIPGYSLNLTKNESKHNRFYFFDSGIARAAEGFQEISDRPERKGFYFEGLILNELKTYAEINRKRWKFFYYNSPSVGEIDLIIETKSKSINAPSEFITLEVKLSKKWDTRFEKLSHLVKDKYKNRVERSICIYLGDQRLTNKSLEIYPLDSFIKALWNNEI